MRLATLAAAAVLMTATLASAQGASESSRTFGARDLFGLQVASDPQVRPDGGAIAYVRVSNDIMTDNARRSIWLVDSSTGAQTPLEAGDAAYMAPRWSPDGARLAYVAAGPDGAQLRVRWMATGRSARVASLEQAPNDVAWSPDGKTLAFTMLIVDEGRPLGPGQRPPEGAKWAEPLKVIERLTYRADGEGFIKAGYRHIFAVSADGGQPRQLTSGPFDNGGPIEFTRDGKAVLFSTNRADDWERDPQEAGSMRWGSPMAH